MQGQLEKDPVVGLGGLRYPKTMVGKVTKEQQTPTGLYPEAQDKRSAVLGYCDHNPNPNGVV